ncbi:Golgi apparatus membrane protein tvp18 [Mortierella sp. AD094]|nr:Golgi apparatus membrane protein tvp18 [Mortierella sp. AD094]
MSLIDEFRAGNFSLYGQWCGLISICCPTSQKFDTFLATFHNSYFRTGAYLVFATLMWIAVGVGGRTIQVVSAILLTLGTLSYGIAAVRGQSPASSAITGGTGVSSIV